MPCIVMPCIVMPCIVMPCIVMPCNVYGLVILLDASIGPSIRPS
jgi:hypothetical protein